jgi:hypothetical protein
MGLSSLFFDPADGTGLADLIRATVYGQLRQLDGPFVARVTAYDDGDGAASVQPVVHGWRAELVDGLLSRVFSPRPLCVLVPVAHVGGGGRGFSCPLAVGDHVVVLPLDRSHRTWWPEGVEAPPQDLGRHSAGDGIIVAVLRPRSRRPQRPAGPTWGDLPDSTAHGPQTSGQRAVLRGSVTAQELRVGAAPGTLDTASHPLWTAFRGLSVDRASGRIEIGGGDAELIGALRTLTAALVAASTGPLAPLVPALTEALATLSKLQDEPPGPPLP